MGRIDLHMHTFLSDGELLPEELASRAQDLAHDAIAITDHVGPSNLEWVLERTLKASVELNDNIGMKVIPGVELTHLPIKTIPDVAERAKEQGAEIIVVHGETLVEPVPPGTNLAAINCGLVDILAHPGIITEEEAQRAAENDVYLELTSRKGHSLSNGRVAKLASEAGAEMLVNTDSHAPDDLITQEEAGAIAMAAGIEEDRVETIIRENPRRLLEELE